MGIDVIVECVNPLAVTRDAWISVAERAGAAVVEVELVCSYPAEHRRRVETRDTDVEGLVEPTWEEVARREYQPWDRLHLIIDSTRTSPGSRRTNHGRDGVRPNAVLELSPFAEHEHRNLARH